MTWEIFYIVLFSLPFFLFFFHISLFLYFSVFFLLIQLRPFPTQSNPNPRSAGRGSAGAGIARHSAVFCFPWEYAHPPVDCRHPGLLQLPLQRSGTFHFNFSLTRPVFRHGCLFPAIRASPVSLLGTSVHIFAFQLFKMPLSETLWSSEVN